MKNKSTNIENLTNPQAHANTHVAVRLSEQSEIVRQRLHYHFAKVGGGWNIEGMNAPFMKEFLNEVDKLVELSK